MKTKIKIIILTALSTFIFLYALSNICKAGAPYEKPLWGDWVCWTSSATKEKCGTYGWSKDKKFALKSALDKCEYHCQTKCRKEYCEKLVKKEGK